MGNIFSRAKEFLCATVEPDPKSFRVDPASTNFPISLMSIHQELKRDSQILSKPDTEFDYSIRPQDSLYDFVNNKWIENAKLPENKSIINPINQLRDETRIKIESLIVPDLSDPLSMFVADFYNSGMNVDQHQADNSHISTINEIMNSNCTESIIRIHTDLYLKGLSGGFFGIQVLPDFKNSTIMIGAIESSGLLMPTRDYYIEDDKRNLRLKYMKYLSTLFDSFGVSADPTLVLSFEIALAKVSLTQNEQRDLGAIYNIFETSDIIRQFSNIPFQLFFEHLVDNPKYYETLSELFKSQSIETLKTYLLAHYLTKQAQFLNDKFRKIHFDFFSTKLMGQLEQSPISEQVLRIMSTVFKNPLGQLFARRYFSEDSKQQVLEMIEYIVNSFRDRLTRIDWMSPQTRKNAIEKLNAIKFKIGYPDIYRDCSNLYKEMSSLSSFTLKFSLLQRHEFQHQISLIGKQPDPNEWEIEAYTVNAAYLPLSNEICFPAAFIQSPIYNQPTASNSYIAENFGALGTVIAHELTHGRNFDLNGNLTDWWQEIDSSEFKKRTDLIRKQYSQYQVLDKFVDGDLTLGENIADNGGLVIAFEAMKEYIRVNPGKVEEGQQEFSIEQRFFISNARLWRTVARKELQLKLLKIDPHSPGRYRIDGVVKNVDAFYDAFGVVRGDNLWLDEQDRVKIF